MDVELVICSIRLEDPHGDGELIRDVWPVNGSVGDTEAPALASSGSSAAPRPAPDKGDTSRNISRANTESSIRAQLVVPPRTHSSLRRATPKLLILNGRHA
jgi:hypothetical protein